ncbi:MAG: response regulator transcription factor, partial [Bacteroidia bacterium]|nr:response regulator transcription factor [Bacteroidia bacterium]
MKKNLIRIILAEDHLLQLEGLSALLKKFPELNVVRSFHEPADLLKELDTLDFDILLADLHMPGITGLDLADELKKRKHPAKIILLTMQRGTRFMQRAEKAGVSGYLLKSITAEDLKNVIIKIHNGEIYFDPEIKKYS